LSRDRFIGYCHHYWSKNIVGRIVVLSIFTA
jgi:hypothetical protein